MKKLVSKYVSSHVADTKVTIFSCICKFLSNIGAYIITSNKKSSKIIKIFHYCIQLENSSILSSSVSYCLDTLYFHEKIQIGYKLLQSSTDFKFPIRVQVLFVKEK